MTTRIKIGLAGLLLLLLGGLGLPATAITAGKADIAPALTVMVGIAPHRQLCKLIGGRRIRVSALLPPGKSPASFVPTPAQVRELGRARLYFSLGLPFEQRVLERLAQMPEHPEIVSLQEGLELKPFSPVNGNRIRDQKHLDPHTWLDPRLAARQAATMARALSRIDPAGQKFYQANLEKLQQQLDQLYRKLKTELAPLKGKTLLVYHPAFGYFARAFGLEQLAIETAGKRPKGRTLATLIRKARQRRVRAIFVEPQFDRRNAEKIAQSLNCEVVQIDPLAADYSANLERIAAKIRHYLSP